MRFRPDSSSAVLALALLLGSCGFGSSSGSGGDPGLGTAQQVVVDPDDVLVAGFGGLPDAQAHSGVFLDVIADPANSPEIHRMIPY